MLHWELETTEGRTVLGSRENTTGLTFPALCTWFVCTNLISLVGTISSILLLCAILTNKSLRSGCGILIVHLLFQELITCSAHYPLFTVKVLLKALDMYSFTDDCHVSPIFFVTVIHAGNWSACFLAWNRFIATLIPLKYEEWMTTKINIAMIVISWMIGISCNIPPLFNMGLTFFASHLGTCEIIRHPGPTFSLIVATGAYIPITLLGLMHLTIYMRTRFRWPCWDNRSCSMYQTSPVWKKRLKRRIMIARMLFASFIWYCMCFLPVPILLAMRPDIYFGIDLVLLWSRFLLLCGYAANPLIFICMNSQYRKAIAGLMSNKPRSTRLDATQ